MKEAAAGEAKAEAEAEGRSLRRIAVIELRAYPRGQDEASPGRVWTGPRALYEKLGFQLVRKGEPRCTLRRGLGVPGTSTDTGGLSRSDGR